MYVVLEGAGAPRSVYFSDQKFGGTQHALVAAIQERDRLVLGLKGAVQQAVALRRERHPAQLITDEQVTKAIQFGAQVLEQNAWRTGGEASPMHA